MRCLLVSVVMFAICLSALSVNAQQASFDSSASQLRQLTERMKQVNDSLEVLVTARLVIPTGEKLLDLICQRQEEYRKVYGVFADEWMDIIPDTAIYSAETWGFLLASDSNWFVATILVRISDSTQWRGIIDERGFRDESVSHGTFAASPGPGKEIYFPSDLLYRKGYGTRGMIDTR